MADKEEIKTLEELEEKGRILRENRKWTKWQKSE